MVSDKPWKSLHRNAADLVTNYTYDHGGNVTSVTNTNRNITMYTYDDLGRLVETDSPDTGTTLYSYDETGNLRYKIQNGLSTQYQYDVLGRLTQILYRPPPRVGDSSVALRAPPESPTRGAHNQTMRGVKIR